jgi:hypothetical protein
MDDDSGRKILARYWAALRARSETDESLPDVPVFRGTMLIRADGTEYHYDDTWCRAESMRDMGRRLKAFLDKRGELEGRVVYPDSLDEDEPCMRLDDVVTIFRGLDVPSAPLACKILQSYVRLLSQMSFANWHDGMEHRLWEALQTNAAPDITDTIGWLEVYGELADFMRLLSDAIGGWVDYDGIVPMSEWRARHEEWKQRYGAP